MLGLEKSKHLQQAIAVIKYSSLYPNQSLCPPGFPKVAQFECLQSPNTST